MATIATLSDALDTAAKFFRVMEKEGVERPHYQHPIDSKTARRNLAEFLKEGCPDISREIPGQSTSVIPALLTSQQLFYRQFFGMELDFSGLRVPTHQTGFDRLIIVAQGLTPNRVYEAYEKNGIKCWRYTDDLDSVLDWDKEERNPKDAPYAIWVRDRQEADEELKNLSANQIKERGITTETLTERELHGLMCWSETKRHLDTDNITRCSGSRYRGGSVPSVGWNGRYGGVGVSYYGSGNSRSALRSRAVVS